MGGKEGPRKLKETEEGGTHTEKSLTKIERGAAQFPTLTVNLPLETSA